MTGLPARSSSNDGGSVGSGAIDARVGRYRLAGLLARGGMAEVFRARTHGPGGFEKEVALKRVLPHLAGNKELTSLFLDEARLAARLAHPNVVQVFDFGESDGAQFLAMELLDGVDLSRLIRYARRSGEPLPVEVLALIGADAAAGLHYAHTLVDENGRPLKLVHRDVSPSNLFLTTHGAVKLLDFGIAKAEGQLHHSMAGQLKGKHAYVAPEQIADEELDPAADIWSLGATLYEAFTGVRLFERSNMMATLLAILDEPITSPRDRRPDLPEGLARVVLRCLERDRARRYVAADEVRADLKRALSAAVGPDDVAALVRRVLAYDDDSARPRTPRPVLLASSEEEAVRSLEVSVEIVRPQTPATPLAWPSEVRAADRVLPEGARVLGDYLLEGAVGATESGVLHRARSLSTDTQAFVVVLHAPPSAELSRALAGVVEQQQQLEHRNLLRVVASGGEGELAWIASEPSSAVPLLELRGDDERLPSALAALLAGEALRGLAEAHDRRLALGSLSAASLFVTTDGVVKVFGAGLGDDDGPASARRDLADLAALLVHAMAGEGEGPALLRAPWTPLLLDAVLERLAGGDVHDGDEPTARRALVELTPLSTLLEERYRDVLRSFAMEPRAVTAMLERDQAKLEVARARMLVSRGDVERVQSAVSLLRAHALDETDERARAALDDLARTHGWQLDAPPPLLLVELERAAAAGDRSAARRLVDASRAEGRWLTAFVWLARLARTAPGDDEAREELLALAGSDPSAPFGKLPTTTGSFLRVPTTSPTLLTDPRTPSGGVRTPLPTLTTRTTPRRGLPAVDLAVVPRARRRAPAWAAASIVVAAATGGALLWRYQTPAEPVAETKLASSAPAENGSHAARGASDNALSRGMRALDEGRWDDAVSLFHDVIERDPRSTASVDARFGRAHANAERGHLEEAAADYRDLTTLLPTTSDDHARALRLLDLVERRRGRAREP